MTNDKKVEVKEKKTVRVSMTKRRLGAYIHKGVEYKRGEVHEVDEALAKELLELREGTVNYFERV